MIAHQPDLRGSESVTLAQTRLLTLPSTCNVGCRPVSRQHDAYQWDGAHNDLDSVRGILPGAKADSMLSVLAAVGTATPPS